jgi:hypothetical protein
MIRPTDHLDNALAALDDIERERLADDWHRDGDTVLRRFHQALADYVRVNDHERRMRLVHAAHHITAGYRTDLRAALADGSAAPVDDPFGFGLWSLLGATETLYPAARLAELVNSPQDVDVEVADFTRDGLPGWVLHTLVVSRSRAPLG